MMNLLILNLTISSTVMSRCKQQLSRPWIWAVGICTTLWAFLVISTLHSWADEHLSLNTVVYRLFPVYVHIGCLLVVCILVSGMSWYVFYKNDFACCFSTIGFLFYVLAEIILMVNSLTMENKSKIKFHIESLVVFVLLFAYTSVVSWEYNRYTERQRLLHEEHIARQITSNLTKAGLCYRLPLKGPSMLSLDFKKSTSSRSKVPPSPAGPSNKR